MISVSGLTKRFGRNIILNSVDLDVKPGETVGIIGPSGSGKTTLLRILDLLEEPDSGTILLFGKKVRQDRHLIRRSMSFLFQRPTVFNSTVLDNLSYPLKIRGRKDPGLALRYAKKVRLKPMQNALKLSGGEIQRLALARCFMTSPEIILLDEPTTHLDYRNIEIFEEFLKAARKGGATIIISSHDIEHIKKTCDRILAITPEKKLKEVMI